MKIEVQTIFCQILLALIIQLCIHMNFSIILLPHAGTPTNILLNLYINLESVTIQQIVISSNSLSSNFISFGIFYGYYLGPFVFVLNVS